MNLIVDRPPVMFILSLLLLWLAAVAGAVLSHRRGGLSAEAREDFSVVQAATLTLLGLIIGFSFSMAVSRYDQRKNYEEEEANAIGTEMVRADLLPSLDAENVRKLLRRYVEQRIQFYTVRDPDHLREIAHETAQTQTELWSAIREPATAQPTPITALVVSGMNDVLNTEGYTQAAWRNRIPPGAWVLMLAIAIFCNGLIGYGRKAPRGHALVLFIWPLVASISFALIADVDSPRGGVIRVVPQNLTSVARSVDSN
jgi:hypothetical protein